MVTITPQGFKVGDKICWHNQPDSSVYTIEKITSHGYLWLSCGGKAIPFVEHPARFQFAPLDGETQIDNAKFQVEKAEQELRGARLCVELAKNELDRLEREQKLQSFKSTGEN